MSWMNVRTAEGNDRVRREMGHDFPRAGSLRQLSYCRKCGCGASFAPTAEDPDFQRCPGRTTEIA